MHGSHAVDTLVCVWVRRQAGGIQVVADTVGIVVDPITHGVVLGASVGCLDVDSDGHEIRPAFAHTTCFGSAETSRIGWATSETVGKTVGVFVDYNTSVKGAVAVGSGVSPDVH